jgi:alkylation response protein AidB-like acyl-CoA dehydrogenase
MWNSRRMAEDLTPEQLRLKTLACRLADEALRPHAAAVDLEERFPQEGFDAVREAGLWALNVPRAFGGLEADAVSSCLVVEELARGCASTGALMLTWAGGILAIDAFGTEAQKQKYLPGIAEGRIGLSFALTERHCGSDAAAIRSTAVRDGGDWVLNGEKCWIGNAARADVVVVAVKTDPDAGAKGITSFLVEKGSPGLRIGEIYSKLGGRGTIHSDVHLEDLRIPADQMLGEVGRGFIQMMHSLDFVRLLTAAHAIGIAQAAYDEAVAWARSREAFGEPLFRRQAIAFMVADMAVDLHAARLITHEAARKLDAGQSLTAEAAMAKLYASEAATRIAHKALQIHGAWGCAKGSVVERAYRDARVTEVWDGTSEIQRLVIARSIFGR